MRRKITRKPAKQMTDKKYLNKRIIIPIIVIVAVAAVGLLQTTGYFVYFFQQPATPLKYGTIEEALRETAQIRERPDYLPAEVYMNLPPFPEDFYEIDTLITYEEIVDLTNLEEEYYKQPEFYPTWESSGVPGTQNPTRGRYVKWGWGAYPADQGYSSEPGGEFTATTFFHASWTVQSYQGMAMNAVFPPTGSVNALPVEQDPEKAAEYFNVTFDPEVFLLEPTFPRFGENWTQKVNVHVKVSEDAVPGTYLIGVNPVVPPQEFSEKMLRIYQLQYSKAGSTGVGRPYFQLWLEIR